MNIFTLSELILVHKSPSDSQVLGPRDLGSASSRYFVLWHTSRLGSCCGLNIFVLTDLYVEALTPKVMVFGR